MAALAGLSRSFPTFRKMAAPWRWVVKSRRRVGCAALLVLSVTTAPLLWWATQLTGLPDVGDPFDVEAFRARTIPDGRNAFVLYRQAVGLYTPLEWSDASASLPVDFQAYWPSAIPEVRRWAEANRSAMALYRRGAERPDALDPSLGSVGEFVAFDALRPLQRMALLEASRLEVQGDMAGAWGWYHAYLRTIHHVGSCAMSYRRQTAHVWHDELRKRLTGWAADPRTTPGQLRRAIDDAVACGAIVPSDSFTLKAEYLRTDRMTGGWGGPGRGMPASWPGAIRRLASHLTPEQVRSISDAWRSWRREPERCRRVIRLLIANRLAFYELSPGRRPGPDPDVPSCDLYPFGPEAPAAARALSPAALGRWLDSTQEPRELIGFLDLRRERLRESANHRALVIFLATQLYRRDHGTDPPTPRALVGRYLPSLPATSWDGVQDDEDNEPASAPD